MKTIIYSALVCVVMSLMSCGKTKDTTSERLSAICVFNFSAETQAGAATNSFTKTQTLDISKLGSDYFIARKDKINNVEVYAGELTITVDPGENCTIENLTITAVGVAGSLVVPSFKISDMFITPSNIIEYTGAFVMKLVKDEVLVTVSGMTDAPAGTIINIYYESYLMFTISQ